MAKVRPSVIKKLRAYASDISEVCRIDKVVLFGSYAKGTQAKESDIDIAVFSREINNSNRHEYMSIFLKHILKYRLDIQPVAFNLKDYDSDSDDFILTEIKKKGIVIYGG
ncbi:MAG: nucleotidyltransferase domain-containing protein [Thermodesulfovibrionales bacterium]|nr:nucleotidyltransferase domain-containing protein [Thermodesulfovibrionales bacterium]